MSSSSQQLLWKGLGCITVVAVFILLTTSIPSNQTKEQIHTTEKFSSYNYNGRSMKAPTNSETHRSWYPARSAEELLSYPPVDGPVPLSIETLSGVSISAHIGPVDFPHQIQSMKAYTNTKVQFFFGLYNTTEAAREDFITLLRENRLTHLVALLAPEKGLKSAFWHQQLTPEVLKHRGISLVWTMDADMEFDLNTFK